MCGLGRIYVNIKSRADMAGRVQLKRTAVRCGFEARIATSIRWNCVLIQQQRTLLDYSLLATKLFCSIHEHCLHVAVAFSPSELFAPARPLHDFSVCVIMAEHLLLYGCCTVSAGISTSTTGHQYVTAVN